MALTFDELDSIAINEIGVELASARNLLNKSSSDFVLDLRTTRHHVNAIEAGDLRIFYGAPFYIDLLRRYAKALNFSENEILEFEKRVLGFVDDKSEGASDSNGIRKSKHLLRYES
ncbi:MAG: helix-turn-helix domain-containing protein [Burkholderiaceae bacterium]